MKRLFEVRTGRTGFSYQRAYVWAENKEQAHALFHEANPGHQVREVLEHFSSDEEPFSTKVSDEGWEV